MRGRPSSDARPLTRRFAAPSPREAGRGATVLALLLLLARQLTGVVMWTSFGVEAERRVAFTTAERTR
jgi:hypothetical protein